MAPSQTRPDAVAAAVAAVTAVGVGVVVGFSCAVLPVMPAAAVPLVFSLLLLFAVTS